MSLRKSELEELIQQGIYGPKQIKPDERRRFLGTLRERVVIVLKNSQVREKKLYTEVKQAFGEYPEAHLYLNGELDYSDLSRYIQLAKAHRIAFSIVTNKESSTDIGLVLACSHAINKEQIYVSKSSSPAAPANAKKDGLLSAFKKMWKRS